MRPTRWELMRLLLLLGCNGVKVDGMAFPVDVAHAATACLKSE